MNFDLRGKKILITGASGGLGRAVALATAARGAVCVLSARNFEELEKTRTAMDRPDSHIVRAFDFSRTDEIAPWFAEIVGENGPFYGIVHAAGVCPVVPVSKLTPSVMRDVFAVNCMAFIELVRGLSHRDAFTAAGAVAVAVSSVSAVDGWPGGTAYCASKGALSAAVRAMSAELASRAIRVLAIEPSHILTPMFDACAARMGVPASTALKPANVAAEILALLSGMHT